MAAGALLADTESAFDALATAAVARLPASGARQLHADGALRLPVHTSCRSSGRTCTPSCAASASPRATALRQRRRRPASRAVTPRGRTDRRRSLEIHGIRLNAILKGRPVEYLQRSGSAATPAAASPCTASPTSKIRTSSRPNRRRGIAGWLVGQAADWLDLGHPDRLPDYCSPDDGYRAFLQPVGFRPLTHTTRGWQRPTNTAP